MATEPQVDARWNIEEWLRDWSNTYGESAPAVRIVRAALAAYDEDHYELTNGDDQSFCSCDLAWPCTFKAHHEAELWKAISGGGE